MVFISGISNDQVRSKMNKWLKGNSNPKRLEAISLAYAYQSEENEIYQSDEDSEENEFYQSDEDSEENEMYLPNYLGIAQK